LLWVKERQVDGEEEGKTEEGDDDKVDEADGDGGCCRVWEEGTKIVAGKANCWAQGLRSGCEGCSRDTVVGENL